MTLPIEEVIPQLRAALAGHPCAVLQAPPGAGKTTLVPLALLDEPWLAGRSIVILEPRRLAARAAATRMAALLGEQPGATAGYRVRFESRVSARTRIEVVTEGILTRRLQTDSALDGVGLVIFDEFHERHLDGDLAFALTLDVQRGLREDLRVLVMSATLDSAALSRLLGNAPVITSQGRSFPVNVQYCERDPAGSLAEAVVRTVGSALREQEGDVLVFLPGAREIRQTGALLGAGPARELADILPLHGDMSWAQQDRAIRPRGSASRRKVVLATPIAETSLTIEGITIVVDSGYARVPQFDPRSGLTRLVTQRISRASADQRSGRAGRTAPGVCVRLWSESTQRGLVPQTQAEIRTADLAPLALELAVWGVHDADSLSWLDAPPAAAFARARALLHELGALDDGGQVSDPGRNMARLPLHPRLSRMLLMACDLGQGPLGCDIAALLGERDIFTGNARRCCDIDTRLEVLKEFRIHGPAAALARGASAERCARVDEVARQFRRLVSAAGNDPVRSATDAGRLLALAYPDRIAMQRSSGSPRYVLASGRGARLPEQETGLRLPFLAVADADPAAPETSGPAPAEGLIHLAAPLCAEDVEQLFPQQLRIVETVRWDVRQEAVVARREKRLGALLLSGAPLTSASADGLRAAALDGVRQLGLQVLPWSREARQWQARILCMRGWFPQEDWPDMCDRTLVDTLGDWLEPHLDGVTRREHFTRLDLARILGERLDYARRQQLGVDAPTHLRMPSGSLVALEYQADAPPVLAVKLQELFGLGDTPRVARGRVPVTLHLLSPARRPIQVTQDLRGFWDRTYAEVRRELKGRYPKHPWPDDPWKAVPTARTRRRGAS